MQLKLPLTETRASNRSVSKYEKRSLSSWDLMQGGGDVSAAGVYVSPIVAENLSAAFASVQLVAQSMATLPLCVYRLLPDGTKVEDRRHSVARLFAGDLNPHQSYSDFMEQMQATVLWNGNAYAEIIRDGAGAPMALIPLTNSQVSVVRFPGTRRLAYDVSDLENGRTRRVLQDEMLHLRDRSDDGLVGKSRLQRARESFGAAIAVEHFASSTYRNQARLSGFVAHPETLGEGTAESLRLQLERLYSGGENAGRIAVLEEGMTWTGMSCSPEDAQLLESRRFTVESVARLFGVPPQLIGDTSGSAYSNVVEASRHFARFTLSPWASKWEQTIARSLFSETDRIDHEVVISMDELLRGDPLMRAQVWRVLREVGAVSANEIRDAEGWNPREDPGGDEYLSPLNMMPEQTGTPKPT